MRLYQQHWWKCNGPCQHRPPFFGMVRRAMNRAPGPSDFWWLEHKLNCNGQFIKIKEPENYKSKQKNKSKLISENVKSDKSTADWFTKNTPKTKPASTFTHSKVLTYTNNKTFTQTLNQTNTNTTISNKESNSMINSFRTQIKKNDQDLPSRIRKLGNTSNNVHGWDISGPSGRIEKDNTRNTVSKSSMFSFSSTLGGSNSGQSILLKKFLHINSSKNHPNESTKKDLSSKLPSSAKNKPVNNSLLNLNQSKNQIRKKTDSKYNTKPVSLIDKLNNSSDEKLTSPIRAFFTPLEKQTVNRDSNKRLKLDDSSDTKCVSCPVCNKMVPSANINQHLDECLLENDTVHKTCIPSTSHTLNNSIINISSSSDSNLDDSAIVESPKARSCADINVSKNNTTNCEQKCLVCNTQIAAEISLSEHLDECMGTLFNDDTFIIDDEDSNNTSAVGNNSIESKYPCPVCMQMISTDLMNQHLDRCLEDKYFTD